MLSIQLLYRYNGDCARLAATSRECNAAVSANACWREALAALEHDFLLVKNTVGVYKSNSADTYGLKTPGFNP